MQTLNVYWTKKMASNGRSFSVKIETTNDSPKFSQYGFVIESFDFGPEYNLNREGRCWNKYLE